MLRYAPPLGLGYIAAVLEKNGHEVAIVDSLLLRYSVDEAADYIAGQKPDIVGISVMSPNYEGAKELSAQIKKRINVPLVFGGPHCSLLPVITMEQCRSVDFLIYGEGEFVFPLLIEAISGRLSYSDIPQLCFRDTNGRVIMNKQEHPAHDLDEVPFPAHHLFDAALYPANTCTLVTSRGCSYSKCAFCARAGLLYEKYRRRTVTNVIQELESLYKGYRYDTVIFFDDNFVQDEDWVVEFCDSLAQKRLALKWYCNGRVDTITEKMVEKMARAGCDTIMYGIESGDQGLLDHIEKGISIQQVKDAVKITKKFNIKTWGYFMLGLPGETPESGKKTAQFAVDLGLDFAQFTPPKVFPGTKLYDLCRQEGTLLDGPDDFYNTFVYDSVLMPTLRFGFVPEAYADKKTVAKILKFAYIKFYLRLGYIKGLLKTKKNRPHLKQFVTSFLFFIRIIFSKLH